MEILKKSLKEHGSKHCVRSVWLHNSKHNIGPMAEWIVGSGIRDYYTHLVFMDDDMTLKTGSLDTLRQETRLFPNDMICAWGLNFENPRRYWDRTMPQKHRHVKYCGSGFGILSTDLLQDIQGIVTAFPLKYAHVSDLWLNAYIKTKTKHNLIKSGADYETTELAGDKAMAQQHQPGMRDHKIEFHAYLSEAHGWPFSKLMDTFDKLYAEAIEVAESGDEDAALRLFRTLTKEFPHKQDAWDAYSVALMRRGIDRDEEEKKEEAILAFKASAEAIHWSLHEGVTPHAIENLDDLCEWLDYYELELHPDDVKYRKPPRGR